MLYLNNNYILKAYFWNCHKIFVCLSDINGLSAQAALFRRSSEERRWAAVKCNHVEQIHDRMSAENMSLQGTKPC